MGDSGPQRPTVVGRGMGMGVLRCGCVVGREKKDDSDVAINVNYGVASFIEFIFVYTI
jgi:hypothetical protein